MEQALVPQLATELITLQTTLGSQLGALAGILGQNAFYKCPTREYRWVVYRFLETVNHYVSNTLVGLFGVVDEIWHLMRVYNHSLPVFVELAADTIQRVEACIHHTEILITQHMMAIQDLTAIAEAARCLIRKYENESDAHSKGRKGAQIAFVTLTLAGIAGGAAPLVVTVPVGVARIVALVSLGTGSIGGLISVNCKNVSDILDSAAANLTMVRQSCTTFRQLLKQIHARLSDNKRFLDSLTYSTTRATGTAHPDISLEARQALYKAAQETAIEITGVCENIHNLVVQSVQLGGLITYRLDQLQINQN